MRTKLQLPLRGIAGELRLRYCFKTTCSFLNGEFAGEQNIFIVLSEQFFAFVTLSEEIRIFARSTK
jgi:hypothetical protein